MKRNYKGLKYPKDYVSFWNEKGDYGKVRASRMLIRKKKRYEKQVERRKNRTGVFYDRDSGKMMQICDYQPDCFRTSYCEYPCNGDC
jgi:hypothetical protein